MAPRRRPARPERELHGQAWVDEFAWLRDAEDPQTQAYLRDERAYYDARTAHTRSLQRTMFDEMSRRTLPSDRSVSWRRGGLVYYTCTVAGKEYQQFWRSGAQDSSAELLLDENDLAEGVGLLLARAARAEPGRVGARLLGRPGGRRGLRAAVPGPAHRQGPADTVARTYYTGAWSADGGTFFYVVRDQAYRPYQVWRHLLGTDPADGRPGPAGGRRAVRAGVRGVPVRRAASQ